VLFASIARREKRGISGSTFEPLAATQPQRTKHFAAFQEMIPVSHATIGDERSRSLKALPYRHSIENLTVVHGSPNDLWRATFDNASDGALQSNSNLKIL
jgi:hypothetical protein